MIGLVYHITPEDMSAEMDVDGIPVWASARWVWKTNWKSFVWRWSNHYRPCWSSIKRLAQLDLYILRAMEFRKKWLIFICKDARAHCFCASLGLVHTSDGSGVGIGRKFWSSVNRHDGSDGSGRKRNSSYPSDSDSVQLPTPLFDLHWIVTLLALPIPTPLPIPSLVWTSPYVSRNSRHVYRFSTFCEKLKFPTLYSSLNTESQYDWRC